MVLAGGTSFFKERLLGAAPRGERGFGMERGRGLSRPGRGREQNTTNVR